LLPKRKLQTATRVLKPIKRGFDAVDFSTEFDKLDKTL
jgi:hypothetical protein